MEASIKSITVIRKLRSKLQRRAPLNVEVNNSSAPLNIEVNNSNDDILPIPLLSPIMLHPQSLPDFQDNPKHEKSASPPGYSPTKEWQNPAAALSSPSLPKHSPAFSPFQSQCEIIKSFYDRKRKSLWRKYNSTISRTLVLR